jgi:hypothetical protein
MHPVAAGVVVSEVSLLVALFLLHQLLVGDLGPGVANRTLTYISLFPSAFFLHAPFSESLMLMLAILSGRPFDGAAVGCCVERSW